MANIQNHFFPEEFCDYLLQNGFKDSAGACSPRAPIRYFHKDELVLEFTYSRITVLQRDNIDQNIRSRCRTKCVFDGLQSMEIFEFILLMHVMGAVSLKNFLDIAKSSGLVGAEHIAKMIEMLTTTGHPSRKFA